MRPRPTAFSSSRSYLDAKIAVALGGRVAEEIVYGDVTIGAEQGIREITELARNMVARWGMSEAIGPIAVAPPEGRAVWPPTSETSPRTLQLVDREARRSVDDAHGAVTSPLTEHRDALEGLAHALREHETLDERDAHAAAQLSGAEPAGDEPRARGRASGVAGR